MAPIRPSAITPRRALALLDISLLLELPVGMVTASIRTRVARDRSAALGEGCRRRVVVGNRGFSEVRDDVLAPLPDGLHVGLVRDRAHRDHAHDLVGAGRPEV